MRLDFGNFEFSEQRVPSRAKLLPNQIHVYHIELKADYYVQIRLVFDGFDGIITVYAPSGMKVGESELPHSLESMKEFWWVTREAGGHRLEIRAAKAAETGKYAAQINQLLRNDSQNEELIAAHRFQAEGWQLHEIGTQEALRKAVPKLQNAVSLWEKLDNKWHFQEASLYLGEVYHNLSQYRQAIHVYERLLPLLEDAPNSNPTWTYNNLASSHSAVGEKDKAREYYERSLKATIERDQFFRQTRGEPISSREFAIAFNALGSINLQLGERQKALDFFTKSLPYWNVARDGNREMFGLARAYRGLSQVHTSLGDDEQAIVYARTAYKYSSETSDLIGEVEALNILGVMKYAGGEYAGAAENFSEALKVAGRSGDRNGAAKALTNLAYVHLNLGQLQQAEVSFNQAFQEFREIENQAGKARVLNGQGMLARARGDPKQATTIYAEALRLRSLTRDREGEAETLFERARAYLDLNDLAAARVDIEKALEQIEFVRRAFFGAEMRANYQSTVQRYYELYIRILALLHKRSPLAGFSALAFEKSDLAHARSLLESLHEGGATIREGVDAQLLQRERELQRLLQDKGESQTHLLSGRFTTAQKAEAEGELASLLDKYRQVEAEIRASSVGFAALTQPAALTVADIRRQVLDQDTALLEYSLGDEQSVLWVLTKDDLITFDLPKRTDIEILARQFHTVLSPTPQNRKFSTTDPKLRQFGSTESLDKVISALSQMVLAPAAPYLNKKRLLIVPDGALHYVPFATLSLHLAESAAHMTSKVKRARTNWEPLIVNHEIVILPSASTLVTLRQDTANRPRAPKLIAVFADPVFSATDNRVTKESGQSSSGVRIAPEKAPTIENIAFTGSLSDLGLGRSREIPRLFATRIEAVAIGRLTPHRGAELSLDFAASKTNVLDSSLGQYRIVHFATHALINSRHPEFSGIVLSLVDEHGKSRSGFLQAHEVYNLKLSADLVVLSACETALGKEIKGEGLISLTRGFMYAGAPRVVSSLWKVDSKATAILMERFYRQMLHNRLPPAAALRAAQVSMWRDGRSPNDWASFVIQGEFR
jgi:CHAT domain-containing protein/tetratricopeptide (TPR) repeat protein